jgi:histidinol-phosphate aminotransferase
MSNYLNCGTAEKGGMNLKNYSLSNNIDNEYSEIFRGIDADKFISLINEYPDHNYKELKRTIGDRFGADNIVLGNGSEDLIMRINFLLKNRGRVGIFLPNFYRIMETAGEYEKFYSSYEINSVLIDPVDVLSVSKIKSIWISNPNPMIGKAYEGAYLEELIKKNKKTLFVVDEAAVGLVEGSEKYSVINLSKKVKNLIVIRSFSKLYGIAGLRAGFATGRAEELKRIEAIGMTFPINGLAEHIIKTAIKNKTGIEKIKRRISNNKTALEKSVSENKNITIGKSITNCVFFKHNKINMYKKLLASGILALDLNKQEGIKEKNFIRLTVHSSEILFNNLHDRLFKILKEV